MLRLFNREPYINSVYSVLLRYERTDGPKPPNYYLFAYLIARKQGAEIIINKKGVFWSKPIDESKIGDLMAEYYNLPAWTQIRLDWRARRAHPKKET